MKTTKYFFLNGEQYFTKSDLTILMLMNYLNYNVSLFVLEYNDLICNKKYWDKILINNKDKIEIVTIVGGG